MTRGHVSPTIKASLELLGLDPGADLELLFAPQNQDLKKAYHRMALLYHPDRNPEGASDFQKVTEAYELLCDPVRVRDYNRRHLKEKLHRRVVEGIEITFGSFFGYRHFDLSEHAPIDAPKLTGSKGPVRIPPLDPPPKLEKFMPEESGSILDHPAYDGIEVVYAGKLSGGDEALLKGELRDSRTAGMPWVVLNNQGIVRYLAGDLRGARKCYFELCERVPNNIIFMYRLAICTILEGFKNPQKTFFGRLQPDRIKVEKGIEILRHCIHLGETRTFGRQNCFVIRKTLADVYEKTGQKRKARAVWRKILEDDPKSVEAAFKIRGRDSAVKIQKANARASGVTQRRLLITGR